MGLEGGRVPIGQGLDLNCLVGQTGIEPDRIISTETSRFTSYKAWWSVFIAELDWTGVWTRV